MNFIEAVIKISQTEGFEFCDDEDELRGMMNICVFYHGEFAGKLRWPDREGVNGLLATVDEELEEKLKVAQIQMTDSQRRCGFISPETLEKI